MVSAERRFFNFVQFSDGCCVWTGGTQKGHGRIKVRGKMTGAHRLSWEIFNGAIPAGMDVLHSCDNPTCVKPTHLFLGTHLENMQDRKAKGRYHAAHCKNGHRWSDTLTERAGKWKRCTICRREWQKKKRLAQNLTLYDSPKLCC